MAIFIQLLLTALLILVVYQDFRFRAVSWVIFPLLPVLFIMLNLPSVSLEESLANTMANLGFAGSMFLFVTIYFSIRNRRIVNISNGFIGWGDILFILSLGFLFSPLNFIIFYLASLLITIVATLILSWLNKIDRNSVPLAGLQALLLLLLIIVNSIFQFANFSTDEWLVGFII